jgi:hypothetical protein
MGFKCPLSIRNLCEVEIQGSSDAIRGSGNAMFIDFTRNGWFLEEHLWPFVT